MAFTPDNDLVCHLFYSNTMLEYFAITRSMHVVVAAVFTFYPNPRCFHR